MASHSLFLPTEAFPDNPCLHLFLLKYAHMSAASNGMCGNYLPDFSILPECIDSDSVPSVAGQHNEVFPYRFLNSFQASGCHLLSYMMMGSSASCRVFGYLLLNSLDAGS